MTHDKDYIALINTMRWRKLRHAHLSRHPLCEVCEKKGLVTSATEVHHVHPVEESLNIADKRKLMYDPTNLMSVCKDCHAALHRELKSRSKEKRKARIKEQLDDFNRIFFGETTPTSSTPPVYV